MATAVKAGLLLAGEDLEPVRDACIWIRDGVVESIERATCPQNAMGSSSFVVLPKPANLHVHSADLLFAEYGADMSLEDLVAPPHGLKHRLLAKASREDLEEAAFRLYSDAWSMGAGLLVDFRELGGVGCVTAKRAHSRLEPGMDLIVLGRPGPGWPEACDGLGISSPLDYDSGELSRLASMFNVSMAHVAETLESRIRGDLEEAVKHGFSAVVHGVYLTREDLDMLAERGVGLILCLRSNMWHGIGVPPLVDVLESGVVFGFGTDNAAWMPPNVWEEARAFLYLARLRRVRGSAYRAVRALFVDGYRIVGHSPPVVLEGGRAEFLLFNSPGIGYARDVYMWVVKRVGPENLVARVEDGRVSRLGSRPYLAQRL